MVNATKILKNKLRHSRLDSLPFRLNFSGDDLKCHAPAISCILLFLALMRIYFLGFARPRKKNHGHARAALRALLTVVAPRCSLWASRYIKFASVLHLRVDIPLEVIIEDTINGVIEFRNPTSNLADLMDSGTVANGYTICIKVGWRWWVSCFEWWLLTKESAIGQFESDHPLLRLLTMSELSKWLHANTPVDSPCLSGLSLSLLAPSSSSRTAFCLDYLPQGVVPSLNVGCKTTLEFTAFSPSLRILSTAQVISAIPFINSEHPRRWPRAIVSVLKQLDTSYGPNITINSLSNISVDHEHALCLAYQLFSGKQKNRETSVNILGTKAWRRDLFLVALEAALVRRGWIERWAIQVTVK